MPNRILFGDGISVLIKEERLLGEIEVLTNDSVRRFKGQAAPAIVLTECDLPQTWIR